MEPLKNVLKVESGQVYCCLASSPPPPSLILLAADAGLFVTSQESPRPVLVTHPVTQHIHLSLSHSSSATFSSPLSFFSSLGHNLFSFPPQMNSFVLVSRALTFCYDS